MANQEITIKIHCHNLPGKEFEERSCVRLGVQKGRDVMMDVPGDGGQVTFSVPLRVEKSAKTNKPNFLGPYAHGTLGSGNHFIAVRLDEADCIRVMLHSGSRGVGNRIGAYFIELARQEMRRFFINLPDRTKTNAKSIDHY